MAYAAAPTVGYAAPQAANTAQPVVGGYGTQPAAVAYSAPAGVRSSSFVPAVTAVGATSYGASPYGVRSASFVPAVTAVSATPTSYGQLPVATSMVASPYGQQGTDCKPTASRPMDHSPTDSRGVWAAGCPCSSPVDGRCLAIRSTGHDGTSHIHGGVAVWTAGPSGIWNYARLRLRAAGRCSWLRAGGGICHPVR